MANGIEELADFLKREHGPFRPKPFYERETDSLIYYVRDVPSFGQRINSLFTLFLAVDDNTLVGCEVKGAKRLVDRVGSFVIEVEDHDSRKIRLGALVGYALAPEPDTPVVVAEFQDHIKKLRDDFDVVIDADFFELCEQS